MPTRDDQLNHADDIAAVLDERARRLRQSHDTMVVYPEDWMPQCPACRLGHGHTFREHRAAIALHDVWGGVPGPHRDPESAEVIRELRARIDQIKSGEWTPAPDYSRK